MTAPRRFQLPPDIAPDARHLGVTLIAAGIATALLGSSRGQKLTGATLGVLGVKIWHLGLRASRAAPLAAVVSTAPLDRLGAPTQPREPAPAE